MAFAFAQVDDELDAILDNLLLEADDDQVYPLRRPEAPIWEAGQDWLLLLPSLRTEAPEYVSLQDADTPPTFEPALPPVVTAAPTGPIALSQPAIVGIENILLGRTSPAVQSRLDRIKDVQGTPTFDPGCPSRLQSLGVKFELIPDEVRGYCAVAGVVKVSSFDGVFLMPQESEMTCDMAERTARWLLNGVRPEAQRQFGQPVIGLRHFSAYSCRRRSGGKISEHGFANALDVAVFQLADGRRFSLEDNWDSDGSQFGRQASTFLKRVGSHACDEFQVVLTPDSNADHYNHFHFDAGPWKSCG